MRQFPAKLKMLLIGAAAVSALGILFEFGPSAFSAGQGKGGEVIARPTVFIRRPPNPTTTLQGSQQKRVGTASPANNPRAQIEAALDRGNRAIDARNYARAERHYRRVLALNPQEPRAHYGLGNVYQYRAGFSPSDQAIEAYKKAIQLKPDFADAHVNLIDQYLRQSRESKAADEQFKEYTRLKAADANVYVMLGDVYASHYLFHRATELYERALTLRPNFAPAYNGLARAFTGQTREHEMYYRKASEALGEALRLQPNYADAYLALGDLYRLWGYNLAEALRLKGTPKPDDGGKYMAAILAYRQALRLKPDLDDAYEGIGRTYWGMERYLEAIENYQQAIRLNPRGDSHAEAVDRHYHLGKLFLQVKNKAGAMTQYRELLKLGSAYADILLKEINQS